MTEESFWKVSDLSSTIDLTKYSDTFLDAIYSYYCLGIDSFYLYGYMVFSTVESNEPIPKYCKSYGRNYIIEKVQRVLKRNQSKINDNSNINKQ